MDFHGRSEGFESFLARLNVAVAAEFPLHEDSIGGTDAQIFGLPRSGTTLLYQLLARTGAVGYPSNIMAMFWSAPWVGARLQVQLSQNSPTLSLLSLAGRTPEPLDPHEFGYFWRRACGHSSNALEQDLAGLPMEDLAQSLAMVHDVFAAPVVYKNFLVLAHLERMREGLPEMRYLAVNRDAEEVAASLLAVRTEIGVESDREFGPTPKKHMITRTDIVSRVAAQVCDLEISFKRATDGAAGDLFVLDYGELCQRPRRIVADILEFLGVDPSAVSRMASLERLPERLEVGRGASTLSQETRTQLSMAMDVARGQRGQN